MKQKVDVTDYAELITKMLPKGILLNTMTDRFNSMVIGWGHLGTLWSIPTFVVYVRQSRFTKEMLDKSGEFTVSVPLEKVDPGINRICGTLSGRDIDKVKETGITLEDPEVNHTPGIREYPLTIECKVIYTQDQVIKDIPDDIVRGHYPMKPDGSYDFHTMYVGQILDAYIIK